MIYNRRFLTLLSKVTRLYGAPTWEKSLGTLAFGTSPIYAAIDVMAFLNMPADQTDVTRTDFIDWAERYLKFSGQTQIAGADLYGARCGVVHTYSEQSKMSRDGKCRMLMYVANMSGDQVRDAGDRNYILVSIAGMKSALFAAIDRFLVDVFASTERAKIAEKRLQKLLIAYEDVPGTDPHLRPFLETRA
jgi:hypothetical protein